jgi:hypothetical protein
MRAPRITSSISERASRCCVPSIAAARLLLLPPFAHALVEQLVCGWLMTQTETDVTAPSHVVSKTKYEPSTARKSTSCAYSS